MKTDISGKTISVLIILFALLFHGFFFIAEKDSGDFKKYTTAARLLNSHQLRKERLTDFSPVYLYFHSGLLKTGLDPVFWGRFLQFLITVFSVFIFFRILLLYFSSNIALAGTLIFILSREVLIYEFTLEPEPFMIFFITGFIYFFSLFNLKKGNTSLNIILSSVFFSMTLVTRANLFLLILIIPGFIYITTTDKDKKKRTKLLNSILFVIPVFLTVSALWIRNYSIDHNFLPYYQNPGYIMFEGNNPDSTGQSAIYPPLVDMVAGEYKGIPDVHHQIYRDFARKITGKNLSVYEVNRFWTGKAKNFIFDEPMRFVKLLFTKVLFFFHNYERHDLGVAFERGKRLSERFPLFFPYWVIASLSILGMATGIKYFREYFIFYMIMLLQMAVLLTGYVSSRQRVALLSVMIFFAVSLFSEYKFKKKRIFLIGFTLILGFLFLTKKNDLMKEEDFLWEKYNNSYKFRIISREKRDKFKLKESEIYTEKTFFETPWLAEELVPYSLKMRRKDFAEAALKYAGDYSKMSFSEKYNFSILLIEAGRISESEKVLKELIKERHRFKRDFYHSSRPYYYLGVIKESMRDIKNAVIMFKKALKRCPGSPFSLSKLYVLTGKDKYYRLLIRYFDKFDAEFITGKDLFSKGDYKGALKKFMFVSEKFPIFRKGLIYLAVSMSRSGDHIGAYNVYMLALKRGLEPVLFKSDILKIFKKRIEDEPDNPASYYYYGIVLEQCGLFKKAKDIYRKGIELKSGNRLFLKRLSIVNKFLSN